MELETLATRWDVRLIGNKMLAIWATCYSIEGPDYVFSTLVRITPDESPDLQIVGSTPSDPAKVLMVVARIPTAIVQTVVTAPSPDGPADRPLRLPEVTGRVVSGLELLWSEWEGESSLGGVQLDFEDGSTVVVFAYGSSLSWSERTLVELFVRPELQDPARPWPITAATADDPATQLIGQRIVDVADEREDIDDMTKLVIRGESKTATITADEEGVLTVAISPS